MKKTFDGFLILNWKNKNMQVRKRKPRSLGSFEILVRLNIDVAIPETPDITIKGDIEVPVAKVGEMVLECI